MDGHSRAGNAGGFGSRGAYSFRNRMRNGTAKMKPIPFWKMSGSGNDFVLIDNRRRALRGDLGQWAKKLCHRQFGVGADGLLLLGARPPGGGARPSNGSPRAAFRMVYYNA